MINGGWQDRQRHDLKQCMKFPGKCLWLINVHHKSENIHTSNIT